MSLISTISPDQLVALNDEMAALARAGVPLPEGLREFGQEYPGGVGRISSEISRRLSAGESLESAVSAETREYAPIYAAVIRAGVRSGRLAAALESLSATVRRIADIRRAAITALVYPLILLLTASVLFYFVITKCMAVISITYGRFDVARPLWYETGLSVARFAERALPWFWVVLAVLAIWGLRQSRQAISGGRGLSLCLPPLGRVLRSGRLATFTEILATLLEHQTPMDEALSLAAGASGDLRLQSGAAAMAEQIRRGDTLSLPPPAIPPMMGWLLRAEITPERRAAALRRMAIGYRRKLAYWGGWLVLYLPIFISAVIGGAVTLFYSLIVLAPFYHLLYQLSVPQ